MKNEWLRECIRIVRKGQTLEDQDICLRTIEAALAELAALEAELEACKLTAKYLDEGAAKLVSDNAAMRGILRRLSDVTDFDDDCADAMNEADALLALTPDSGKVLVCEWSGRSLWEESAVWETQCGNTFYFGDGAPCEDGIDFCCYCGKKIVRIDADPLNTHTKTG